MLLWASNFRAVFWIAVIPGLLAVVLLVFGVREPKRPADQKRINPIYWNNLKRLRGGYWSVVVVGALFVLARFSEAFLILRAQEGGLPVGWIPMVLVA